jgi:hypothetical protein
MTSLLNFIKLCQLVQKLIGGEETDRHTQDGELIGLYFSFRKESRLKSNLVKRKYSEITTEKCY